MSTPLTLRVVPVRELCLVGLATVATFFLLAIVSYSPADPGFSFAASSAQARNLVGTSGAYFADLVLYLFGYVAYLLPAALVLLCLRLLRGVPAFPGGFWLMVRSSGWLCVCVCGCILLHLHSAPTTALPAGPGGIVGQWLSAEGAVVFGWVGLTVLCAAGAIMGLQAAAGFSWLEVAEFTGRQLFNGARWSMAAYDAQRDRWQARRARRAAERDAKVSAAPRREIALPAPGDIVDATPQAVPAAKVKASVAKNKTAPQILPAAKEGGGAVRQRRLFNSSATGELPALDLLDERDTREASGYSADSLEAMSRQLELKLADFGVEAVVVSVLPGPVVTRFEIQPAAGVKVQKISGLAKDLARSLAVISVRIVEVIPGKSVVGIEIPNEQREMVRLKEVITSAAFQDAPSPVSLALGKDIAGASVVTDIAKMPHLLVAGTTGSGKSVGVNAMLLSILFKATPEEVRLILVDPKMLELSVYEGIPHLLAPVVTDMKEAAHALNWCVAEMERRYRLMAALGVRNLAGFNKKVRDARDAGEPLLDPLHKANDLLEDDQPAELGPLPTIVVVIDEFADMMMIVGKKVEQLIARIAQKARAAGIHLVLATQRPSVDVITGLIKANIPARIGFQVSSKIDSRTILDQGGAEQLLGHGDMLFLPPGTALPQRIHGAFVSDDEVHRVVSDWKQRGEPAYLEEIVSGDVGDLPALDGESGGDTEQDDELYDEAVAFVLESRRASISSVQRKLRIGYNRAARLIEAMEAAGVVSPMNSNGSRDILVPNRE